MAESLLRIDEVKRRTGLGRSTVYRLVAAGEFPRPIRIAGTNISAWPSSAIDAWIAEQIQANHEEIQS